MRKTGGGPGEACLTELEAKIRLIKGNEAFEGVQSGIDLSIDRSAGFNEERLMVISPLPSQELETKLFMDKAATRKRNYLVKASDMKL